MAGPRPPARTILIKTFEVGDVRSEKLCKTASTAPRLQQVMYVTRALVYITIVTETEITTC